MYKSFLILPFLLAAGANLFAQGDRVIKGKIKQAGTLVNIANATISVKGKNINSISASDGSFRIKGVLQNDSLQVSCIGYATQTIPTPGMNEQFIVIELQPKPAELEAVIVGSYKKPAKSFMQQVIDAKAVNDPSRFRSYSYQRYTRNELDIDNIDFEKTKGNGLKSLMLKAFAGTDSTVKQDKQLPLYFEEVLANNYHSVSPKIEQENIIAKKNLGLKTDAMLGKLGKFYFHFNVYENWLPIFNETYVSPLNDNAFNYYQFFEGDSLIENGEVIQLIRFEPKRAYERAFEGNLWINKSTLAVESVVLRLVKTANLNFVKAITYQEEYRYVNDNSTDSTVYMPWKYSSEVKFESGLELIGIPIANKKENTVHLSFKNTTVADKIKINTNGPTEVMSNIIKKEKTVNWDKTDQYWIKNRPDSLSSHEKNIYIMVDSLKENKHFQTQVKLLALAGTGSWDFGNYIRVGPYSSFLSNNHIEGWRVRLGFWTLPGLNKKLNIYGYGAYGFKDMHMKGLLGIKYLWNAAKYTKTTLAYSSDYDFVVDQEDELDNDNLLNTAFRKKIPFTRTYVKQVFLKHEQYLNPDFTATASLSYKELNPVFDFKFRAINPAIDKPYDSVFQQKLPVAEAKIGIRYAHNEKTRIVHYDNLKMGTYSPVLFANYTYGFEINKAPFDYQKINIGIEQRLRLPPKSMLYYRLEAGKTFGTLPYIILNVPPGNQYYVASKYLFNTMAPIEFAADKYVSLHTRYYLGGVILDKIPFIRKLGWRERFSFNSYYGSMSAANIAYNKNSNFNLLKKIPFMEASFGIENIFHIMSVEYYRRISYLTNPYAQKSGIYIGVTLAF